MGLNVDKLREGLKNYDGSLDSHLNKLQADFESLMGFYNQFANEYEGRAAEEFKLHWEQTANWFEEYQNMTKSLSQHLEDRIKHLDNI